MSIAKMSTLHNPCRYLTVAIDEYNDRCLKGIIFSAEKIGGIKFEGFLEMLFFMNQIYDDMSWPKQTVEFRSFPGCPFPEFMEKEAGEQGIRSGKLATCRIFVQYRYFASWQGNITWIEKGDTRDFESFLQLLEYIDETLRNQSVIRKENQNVMKCHLAIDSYSNGQISGWLQRILENHREVFLGIPEIVEIFEQALDTEGGDEEQRNKIISEAYREAYRKNGKRATFTIRILYREHHSWQGMIYWREQKKKESFRSFLEMLILITSALEYQDVDMMVIQSM